MQNWQSNFVLFQGAKVANSHSLFNTFATLKKYKRTSQDVQVISLQTLRDDKTIDAVIRNFEIIGEAANKIDHEFRIKNPKIEWKRIRGFRNRIIHNYFGIDNEIVWEIIENNLSELIECLEVLIDDKKDFGK